MFPGWVFSLRHGIRFEDLGSEVAFVGPFARTSIRAVSRAAKTTLARLAPPGESVALLLDAVLPSEGPAGAALLCDWLRQLTNRGYLTVSICNHGQPLASLEPIARSFVLPTHRCLPARSFVLSRFAYLRRLGAAMALESPLSAARVILHDARATTLIHALVFERAKGELSVAGLSSETIGQLMGLLLAAQMLTEQCPTSPKSVAGFGETRLRSMEDESPLLRTWEFHDLLFHTRSREGRHDLPMGAVYPWVGELPPPPATKPPAVAEFIELARPDLEDLLCHDLPFALVQERRSSIREYGAEPLTAQELGEFLYRVARVRDRSEWPIGPPDDPLPMEFTSRPYPAGGALYELEVYAVVQRCDGLAPGLYHYDPLRHGLERFAGLTAEASQLLAGAGRSAGVAPESLQVLLVVASRFQRVAWKYSSMAYALTLKNVGVLYQTMYLAATAMGLAPCALGCGDSDLFAAAIGGDYYAETSVGEFLLGSRQK